MWYSHTVEQDLAIKRNRRVTHAATWMDFENTVLSKRRQSQKSDYMIPLM